jgi:hypothetical protein
MIARIIFGMLVLLVATITGDLWFWYSSQCLVGILIFSSVMVVAFLIGATTFPGRALEELMGAVHGASENPASASKKLRQCRWFVPSHKKQIEVVARQIDEGRFATPEAGELAKRLASSYARFTVYQRWFWRIIGAGLVITYLGRAAIHFARASGF